MYALVRFLEDLDHRRHVIPIEDIRNFSPANTKDFDNKAVYTVFWRDGADENTGDYTAQILLLGATEEKVRERPKRVPVPKMTVDESSDDEPPAQRRKQALKKKKNNQASVKAVSYGAILKGQLSQAHRKNATADVIHAATVSKRHFNFSAASDSDESLVASNLSRKNAEYWKEKCLELREDNKFLKEQVRGLHTLLGSKIFRLEETMCSKEVAPVHGAHVAARTENVSEADTGVAVASPVRSNIPRAEQNAATAMAPACRPVITQVDTEPAMTEDFTFLPDGSLHLQKGFVATPTMAKKLMGNAKPSLVVKDAAQTIWGNPELATRSVTGVLAPKKRGTGELPKPPLTPQKIDVVRATLSYWGAEKKIDVAAANTRLMKILTEKIQDCIKGERRHQEPS